jgi:hypothetical protein
MKNRTQYGIVAMFDLNVLREGKGGTTQLSRGGRGGAVPLPVEICTPHFKFFARG